MRGKRLNNLVYNNSLGGANRPEQHVINKNAHSFISSQLSSQLFSPCVSVAVILITKNSLVKVYTTT